MLKLLLKILLLGVMITACAPTTPAATPTLTPLPPTTTPVPPTATLAATVQPTAAGPDSLFPPITADEWQIGPTTAQVTIIEYSDFQ